VALVFGEPSTRTRFSFERAAVLAGAWPFVFQRQGSSAEKGETLLDSVRLLVAVGASVVVLRDATSCAPHRLAEVIGVPVVNAGDGTNEHPTQALLDAWTLRRHFGRVEGLRVAFVGDVRHSRVARSGCLALTALGADVVVAGPAALVPPEMADDGARLAHRIDEVLDCDAIVMLRVQRERLGAVEVASREEYRAGWAMTEERAGRMRDHAVVMHPAPMNRGFEIDDAVADGPRSLILAQQRNGVAVRRAVLERFLASAHG
jgi:aspartate carbamoyltransferase catalytic subunit